MPKENPTESKEVWRMKCLLEVGLRLREEMMGFEVKEMKGLVLAMPKLDKRMAIKEGTPSR